MPTLVTSSPANGATEVRLYPPRITLDLAGDVDRTAIANALTVAGTPDARPFMRWSAVVPSPGAAPLHRLEVMLDRPFHAWANHTVTIPVTGGVATVQWKTRANLGDYEPAGAVHGDSRRDLAPGAYKRALVLSGGGAKGAFQVGAVKYLYGQEGFFPDLVVGTSVGAVNGVKLAEATTVAEHRAAVAALEQFWLGLLDDRDVYDPDPDLVALGGVVDGNVGVSFSALETVGVTLASLLPIFGSMILGAVIADKVEDAIETIMRHADRVDRAGAINSFAPLRRVIERNLDAGKVQRSAVDLRLGAVDLFSGREVYFAKTEGALVANVVASSAIPAVFQPERGTLNGRPAVYVDGGLRIVCGLEEAVRLGATDIVVVPTYSAGAPQPRWHDGRYQRTSAIAERSLELVYDQVMARDVEAIRRYELLLAERAGRDLRIRVVEPEVELLTSIQFQPEAIRRAIGYGFERARQVLGDGRGSRPNPIGRTRTANLLVIEPHFSDGRVIRDDRAVRSTDGGLGDHFDVRRMPSVRIVTRFDGLEGPHYPSDGCWAYGDVAVPGSDPDGDGLEPMLPKERKGLVYALPLHVAAGVGCEVDVIVSWCRGVAQTAVIPGTTPPVDWQPYEERRVTVPIQIAYDASGVQRVVATLPIAPAAVGQTSRACVLLPAAPAPTPAFTIHGTGELADLAAVAGLDGKLAGGRFEVSRDPHLIRWSDRGDGMTAIGLTTCEVWATWASVEVFAEPNFRGASKKLTGMPTGAGVRGPARIAVGFPIRSIRVKQIDPAGPFV